MAKVEVVNFNGFNFLKKFAKILSNKPQIIRKQKTKKTRENKYWIHGEEWQVVDNIVVQELRY